MIKQLKYKNIAWLDLTNPTKEEVSALANEYKLHPVIEEELLRPSNRVKVDWYEDCIYLTLHFPITAGNPPEIDFILGKDFLITSHYEPIPSLLEFSQILDGSLEDKKDRGLHAGHLFFYVIRELYQPIDIKLDSLNRQLKTVEEKIFTNQEAAMVRTLSQINRQLLDLKWSLKFHREILNSLKIIGQDFYGKKFDFYLNSIISEYERISETVKSNREIFSELHNTNESLLTIKNGQTMRVLTVLAFIFMPVSLISFIFSMSGSETIVQSMSGWIFVLGLMVSAAVIMATVAKYKKWI